MKTRVFSDYHPEWAESFDQMRRECEQLKNAQEQREVKSVRKLGKQKSKSVLEVLKKMKAECASTYNGKQVMNGEQKAQNSDTMNIKPLTVSAGYVMKAECASTYNGKQVMNGEQKAQNSDTMNIKPLTVSADYVKTIHSYAQPTGKCVIHKFECDKCKYKTDRKSNYDDHISSCGQKPAKNVTCPICRQRFIYRTLRHHLNYFASGKHSPANVHHSKYTPNQHQQILNYLKNLKKTNQV